ncbi:Intradiol ring-cleavage dioxygenase [Aspergillus karnatakaensis]|uniref:intradiol ring-cleavage dioxygenase n=1 Tax=Aspergillus karnatakaensis TaxID=1810916 RepID=UPI003CCD1637
MVHLSTLVAGAVGLATVVSAHPGHDVKAEAAERAAALKGIRARSVKQCATELNARGVEASNIARREATLEKIRQERNLNGPLLKARDLTPLNTSHHSDLVVDLAVDPEVLFSSGGTCVLAEDVTQGPYYVTGELIRNNLVEDQEGVPLYLDIQLIDANTCEPVPDTFIDFWHCNSTGVYSGVVASGNGDSSDESNLDSTFLRGLQRTDTLGVAQFHTLFPGHYTGRATHIHVLSHPANETTVNRNNNTISGLYTASSSHVGQIFFDQDLISLVEETEHYATNTQELTTNAEDSILLQELEDDIDPFVEYVLLGEDVSDGVFAWISVVVDSSESTSVTPAAYLTEDGGVENENSGMGGPGGGAGGPPGGVPSGVPSGVPPS